MNVTLIYPLFSRKRSAIDANKQYWPPLGLAYIAAVLEKSGHRVQILDRDIMLRKSALDFDRVDRLTVEKIRDFSSELVGISATTPNMPDVGVVSRLVKKDAGDVGIVLGGPHASGEPVLSLEENPFVDVVVRGEGEGVMLDLAEGRPLGGIKGVTYRQAGGIASTPDRDLLRDIDDLPLPARHLLDMEHYTRPSRFSSRSLSLRTTSILTARGCPYRCRFCAGPLVFRGGVRFHSKERVLQEIEELTHRYGVEALYFAEDMFLASMTRARGILSLYSWPARPGFPLRSKPPRPWSARL